MRRHRSNRRHRPTTPMAVVSCLAGLAVCAVMPHVVEASDPEMPAKSTVPGTLPTKVPSSTASRSAVTPLWDLEPPLVELARTATFSNPVPPTDPQPIGTWGGGTAVNLSTPKLKVGLWGPPSRLTLSLGKTDVWDRRRTWEPPLTLAEIRRTVAEGKLPPDSHYKGWNAYDWPSPKPVGQIILLCPDLESAIQPAATTHCHDGSTRLEITKDAARAVVTYVPMMTQNLIAVQCECENLKAPVSVRLYRHRDTVVRGKSMQSAGGPDPRPHPGYDYDRDTNNDPLEPPASGTDGATFWIRQNLPPEKTFPQGFSYVMAGRVIGPAVMVARENGKPGLGTPPHLPPALQKQLDERQGFWNLLPSYGAICGAEGSAVTATLRSGPRGRFTLLVAVVTSNESDDPLAEARRRLDVAGGRPFADLSAENAAWYARLYQRREKGRVFRGDVELAKAQVPDAFRSWLCPHSGKCLPDPTQYEADACYAYLEQDWSPWHGLPCYNELYYTGEHVANRSDRLSMWYGLVKTWLPACRKNAREVFNMPGAALLHGYLPPIKADEYAHTTSIWEFCMEIPAQVLKVLWDAFDYGGDERFLADGVYPALRETAIFYSHYATLGQDGFYHVIPTVSAEHWGWTPGFQRNRDSTSALCLIRWLLNRAADASEILGHDEDLRVEWRRIAQRIAPYPTFETPEGPVFTDVRDVRPIGVDYNWFAGFTPALLADEINLDSPPAQKEIMLRTARLVKGWAVGQIGPLLGAVRGIGTEQLVNSRSGRIHLFPAVPDGTHIAFRDMQARGGFEVSAECRDGKVTFVRLRARRAVLCRLMNPWPGRPVTVYDDTTRQRVSHEIVKTAGECVTFNAETEHVYAVE